MTSAECLIEMAAHVGPLYFVLCIEGGKVGRWGELDAEFVLKLREVYSYVHLHYEVAVMPDNRVRLFLFVCWERVVEGRIESSRVGFVYNLKNRIIDRFLFCPLGNDGRKERRDEGRKLIPSPIRSHSHPSLHITSPACSHIAWSWRHGGMEMERDAWSTRRAQSSEPVLMICPVRASRCPSNHIASIHPAEPISKKLNPWYPIPLCWSLVSSYPPPISAHPNPEEFTS